MIVEKNVDIHQVVVLKLIILFMIQYYQFVENALLKKNVANITEDILIIGIMLKLFLDNVQVSSKH